MLAYRIDEDDVIKRGDALVARQGPRRAHEMALHKVKDPLWAEVAAYILRKWIHIHMLQG